MVTRTLLEEVLAFLSEEAFLLNVLWRVPVATSIFSRTLQMLLIRGVLLEKVENVALVPLMRTLGRLCPLVLDYGSTPSALLVLGDLLLKHEYPRDKLCVKLLLLIEILL